MYMRRLLSVLPLIGGHRGSSADNQQRWRFLANELNRLAERCVSVCNELRSVGSLSAEAEQLL
jgi:hypothetical protein